MTDSDDEYTIPLQDQRVFGAGIKRKRVHFIASTTTETFIQLPPKPPSASTRSIGDLYLSLVLPKSSPTASTAPSTLETEPTPAPGAEICELCNLPIPAADEEEKGNDVEDGEETGRRKGRSRPHEASLAHQVCLKHSHPPSSIDRNRKGLTYLSSYGWDPDARLGLGVQGQGIQFPIKPSSKKDANDKMGLGLVVPKEVLRDARLKAEWKKKDQKLGAKKVREMEERDRRDRVKMQDIFYRSEEVERYLGKG